MTSPRIQRHLLTLSIAAALFAPALPLAAQEAAATAPVTPDKPVDAATKTQETTRQHSDNALGQVVVTAATKRGPLNVQDVPLAVTSLGRAQLDELKFQNLTTLSYTVPNVQLDDAGTIPGYANFSIRGLGINSSIPSIDPTVGIFVDGVYMGVSAGMLFDNFDLQNIEILRGPQGLLFGRNVTGGAVLVNTREPSDDFHFDGRVGAETGLKTTVDATVRGPLVKGLLDGKLAVYNSHDQGWFKNLYNGRKYGGGDERIVRAALKFTPAEDFKTVLRFEHGQSTLSGPATQNPALFSPDSHDVTTNIDPFAHSRWTQLFAETDFRVPFGNGTVTNIFGWRKFVSRSLLDVDSSNNTAFHARTDIDQNQLSNELRYAGTFGKVDITAGYFTFTQHQLYIEERLLDTSPPYNGNPPSALLVGGGRGKFQSSGAFLAADWHVTPAFTVNLGARWSNEQKDADVSRLRPGGGSIDHVTLNPDFPGLTRKWNDVSPKVGIQWKPGEHTHLYGYWAKSFRSGGYNFRHTVLTVPVQAFDAEVQHTFELGLKQEFPDHDARINVALFQNRLSNLQRESNDPSIATAVQQIIRNVGDTTVRGVEAEGLVSLGAGFMVMGQFGYTHNKYDKIILDLNGDKVVDAKDYALKLPRAAPWTYGLTLMHDLKIGSGKLSSRISYNHRDAEFYSDNNIGVLAKSNQLDANFTYAMNKHWNVSVYGRNLLNENTWGNDTILPNIPAFGGGVPGKHAPGMRPLARGRVIGAEMRFSY